MGCGFVLPVPGRTMEPVLPAESTGYLQRKMGNGCAGHAWNKGISRALNVAG